MPYVSHEKTIEDNKPEYYLALRQSQRTFQTDHDTILPWLNFFLEITRLQAKMALELLSKESIERLLSPRQLDVFRYLQAAQAVTPKELSEALSIPRPTINQVLNRLMEFDLVERFGLGRGTRYRVRRV